MSRITFRSEHGEAELRGAERAHMGCFCIGLMLQAFGLNDRSVDSRQQHWLTPLLPLSHNARRSRGPQQVRELATLLAASGEEQILTLPDGRRVSPFDISLNTALRLGGDPLRLMARLHGACEIWAWVDGPNRAWLADIIDEGRAMHLYRAGMGWEQVAALLRAHDDGPVVTSFSGVEGFPHPSVGRSGGWCPPVVPGEDEGEEEKDWEAWGALSRSERWRFAVAGLLAEEGHTYVRQLDPDTWAGYWVGSGLSAYDITAMVCEQVGKEQPDA